MPVSDIYEMNLSVEVYEEDKIKVYDEVYIYKLDALDTACGQS